MKCERARKSLPDLKRRKAKKYAKSHVTLLKSENYPLTLLYTYKITFYILNKKN